MSLCAVALAAMLAAAMPAALWAGEKEPRRPNVLLIVSDDQRPDTIAALGNKAIKTPNLDRLVRRGTVFTRAVASNPICTPSRAELISGCTGFRNGVLDFGKRLAPDLTLWPQAMRAAGYRTWYVGKWHLGEKPQSLGYEASDGLFRGGSRLPPTEPRDFAGRPATGYKGWVFQTGDGRMLPEMGVGLTADISRLFADAAIRFIERRPDDPFFLHVNFSAPHDPLIVPPGYDEQVAARRVPLPDNFLPRHPFDHGNFDGRDEKLFDWPRTPDMVRAELACYYAVIEALDAQVGRIVQALEETRQAERTLVIFTSDHGLAIGSHGLRGKQNMYEHTIGVPLLISGPDIPAGRRVDAQCYLRDLYPTVCELAKIAVPDRVEGRSLGPVIRGEVQELYPYTVGYFRDVQRMIRTDRWKLICYPRIDRVQLFDLANDPHELRDLAADAQHQQTISELRAKLAEWQAAHGDETTCPPPNAKK